VEIVYTEQARADISFWKKTGNIQIQKKIAQLLDAIEDSPAHGIGKPEMLKHQLSGFWSRRINQEHRLVYQFSEEDDLIIIHSLKGHY
jgi:toxin YoeB